MRYLFTRKHDKESYDFYVMRVIDWITNKPRYYIMVKSPENCFGYRDSILLDSDGFCYGTDRYHPPYILERLKKQIASATNKYANENTYFNLEG